MWLSEAPHFEAFMIVMIYDNNNLPIPKIPNDQRKIQVYDIMRLKKVLQLLFEIIQSKCERERVLYVVETTSNACGGSHGNCS